MPSGWENYYVVLIAAAVSMIVPGFLAILSQFSKRSHGKVVIEPSEGYRGKLNARFFGPLLGSLILITFALILIPCVVAVKPAGAAQASFHAALAVLVILVFVALSLGYAVKKKDVSWNMSSRELSGNRVEGRDEA